MNSQDHVGDTPGSVTTYQDFPQSATEYIVARGTTKVVVEDAAGNRTVVDVDYTKPIVSGVYRNEAGTVFKLTLKDGESGVDKITTSDGETILDVSDVGTVTKSIKFNIDTPIDSFDLYDEAGNVNKVTDIPIDRTKPKVEITYRKGKCIIKATDNESGLGKIVDKNNRNNVIRDFSEVGN